MGQFVMNYFRKRARSLAESRRFGYASPEAALAWSRKVSVSLWESACCKGGSKKVGVLLACGVVGPSSREMSKMSLVSVKYDLGSIGSLTGLTLTTPGVSSSETCELTFVGPVGHSFF